MKMVKVWDVEKAEMVDYPITDECWNYYAENIGDPNDMGFYAVLCGEETDFSKYPHRN